jgi:hypothetical protein
VSYYKLKGGVPLISIVETGGDPLQLLFSRRYFSFKNRQTFRVRGPQILVDQPPDSFEQLADLDHSASVLRNTSPRARARRRGVASLIRLPA